MRTKARHAGHGQLASQLRQQFLHITIVVWRALAHCQDINGEIVFVYGVDDPPSV
jgi:hypothetical protein